MKKQLLLLVSLFSFSPLSQAVSVNENGLGEVLLFPLYTADAGYDTLLNLVNETAETKAIKVRIREGMNGVEVINFNVYLGAFDHWSLVITKDPEGEGAMMRTADTSCTSPNFIAAPQPDVAGPDIHFRDFVEFLQDSNTGLQRTLAGFVEIFEMGVITEPVLVAGITQVNGFPVDCSLMETSFSDGGVWFPDKTAGMTPPSGGLSGYANIINVKEGTNISYDAVALIDFTTTKILHTLFDPGPPSLSDADPIAKILDKGTFHQIPTATGIDAVSAVLMRNSISNDYVLEPSINAGTDWVITFPTKHHYVNGHVDGGGFPIGLSPFSQPWDPATSRACEEVEGDEVMQYDREQRIYPGIGIPLQPSYPIKLCAQTNLLTFQQSYVLGKSGDNLSFNLNGPFTNGWIQVEFRDLFAGNPRKIIGTSHTLTGLPVIGFAVQKYVNSTLIVNGQAVLSNYAGAVNHRSIREITTP